MHAACARMPGVNLRRAPIESLEVDGLVFAVRWSRRRRTIGISVARGGELRVLAPAGVSARKLESAVRAKIPWVRRKLAEFAALGPPPPRPRFVDGERLPYLGRTHRLVLVDAAEPPVALRHGRFELARGLDGEARAAVVQLVYGARAGTARRARRPLRASRRRDPRRGRGARPGTAPLGRLRRSHPRRQLPLGAGAPATRDSSTTWWCMSSLICTSPTTGRDSGGA